MNKTTPLHTNHTKKEFDEFQKAFISRIAFSKNIPVQSLINQLNAPCHSVLYLKKNIEDLKIFKKRIEPMQKKIYNEWLEEEKKAGRIKS